jgi:hypothetical protein
MIEPSRYQPIWNLLKKDKLVRITAPSPLHRRIIKAVQKRRDQDIAYKYELEEKGFQARMKFKKSNTLIIFTLTISAKLSSL